MDSVLAQGCLSTFLMGLQVDGPCTGVNDGIEERVSAYLQCDKFRPDLCRLFVEASVRARAYSTPPFIESRPFVSSLSNDFSERRLPDLSSGLVKVALPCLLLFPLHVVYMVLMF